MITDINTERLVIGTLLSYPAKLPEARETLNVDCFTESKLQELYTLMCAIADEGKPVNIVTVTSALGNRQTHLVPGDILDAGQMICNSDLSPYIERLHNVDVIAHIAQTLSHRHDELGNSIVIAKHYAAILGVLTHHHHAIAHPQIARLLLVLQTHRQEVVLVLQQRDSLASRTQRHRLMLLGVQLIESVMRVSTHRTPSVRPTLAAPQDRTGQAASGS